VYFSESNRDSIIALRVEILLQELGEQARENDAGEGQEGHVTVVVPRPSVPQVSTVTLPVPFCVW